MRTQPWCTEFSGDDGATYAGPLILANCQSLAEAICADCLLGPNGHTLRVTGPLDETETVSDEDFPPGLIWGHA